MARPTKFRHSLDDIASPALAAQVAGYVSEIELFRKQIEEIQKQIAEVYDDLDEEGFDKAIVRKLVAKRAKGSKADDEAEAIDAYEAAVEKGLSSRARVGNSVPTYPERVSRPATDLETSKDTQARPINAPAGNGADQLVTDDELPEPDATPAGAVVAIRSGATAGETAADGRHVEATVEQRPSALIPAPAADAKPSFTLPPAKPMRPHCLKPEACAGYGSTHCGSCERAAKEARHAQLEDA